MVRDLFIFWQIQCIKMTRLDIQNEHRAMNFDDCKKNLLKLKRNY